MGAPRTTRMQSGAVKVLEIVMGSGPFAGTYMPSLHATKQKQLSAAYRNFTRGGAKAAQRRRDQRLEC